MANEILERALVRIGKTGAFRDMIFAFPTLGGVTQTFSEWVGDFLPAVNGGILLDQCLRDAFATFDAAKGTGSDTERMRAYVRGLIWQAPDLARISVVASDKKKLLRWDPLRDGTFVGWAASVAPLPISVLNKPLSGITSEAVRQLLAARIVALSDAEWIEGVSNHPYDDSVRGVFYELLSETPRVV
jgi:hypothetical protein